MALVEPVRVRFLRNLQALRLFRIGLLQPYLYSKIRGHVAHAIRLHFMASRSSVTEASYFLNKELL